jgi:hypothetical protein
METLKGRLLATAIIIIAPLALPLSLVKLQF